MATLPGAPVIPKNYGESMVLYTGMDRVECVVDGAPPGKNGRLFIIEPGKATKVPYEAGRFILEHYAYTGVVRVLEAENENGVVYDVAAAKTESEALGAESDKKVFLQYIQDCVEDYIKRNKPVPQPPERIMRIIERRGYDLRKYGITPIGWESPDKDGRVTELEGANAHLRSLLETMQKQIDVLMQGGVAGRAGRGEAEAGEDDPDGDGPGNGSDIDEPARDDGSKNSKSKRRR